MWIVSAILTLLIITVFAAATLSKPDFGPRGCDRRRAIAEVAAIVIDRTDALTAGQQEHLRGEVDQFCSSLPPNSLVCVFGIQNPDQGVLATGFCRCRPEDGLHTSAFIGNREQVRAAFQDSFATPLALGLARANPLQESPTSPILEAIHELSTVSDFADSTRPRSLCIFSDMIQNTPALSLYQRAASEEMVRDDRVSALLCNLRNVSVRVWQMERPRDAQLQDPALETFWEAYFLNCGVHDFQYRRMPSASIN